MNNFSPESKLNKFLNEYYKYLAIATSALVIIISFFLLLFPQYQKIKNEGLLEHQEAILALEDRQQYLENVKQMKVKYEVLNYRAWQSLDIILPQKDDIYLLFAQMESFAKENNLILSSININDSSATAQPVADTTAPKEIQEVSVVVNVSGIESYEDFKTFLDRLERNIRILDIDSISYSPDATAYTLTMTTYYLK